MNRDSYKPNAMPKIVDHDRYRAELLAKCFELFTSRGYSAITMRQIAIGLGVSTGTLYHYFESKEVIFEQMVWFRVEQGMREFSEIIKEADPIAIKVQVIFEQIGVLQDEMFRELVLYFDYYQHQQRSGIVRSEILIKVFKTFQPGIENLIGIKDKNAVQLLFSTVDGLLAASIYDCEIDWAAQGKMIGKLMELYAEEEA
jgi:AcrR family transcriptional regulator